MKYCVKIDVAALSREDAEEKAKQIELKLQDEWAWFIEIDIVESDDEEKK